MAGLINQPKILRGAFVEFGIGIPPRIVVFQFNPLTISRTRSATVNQPPQQNLQNMGFAKQVKKPKPQAQEDIRAGQTVTVNPETLNFDIRLDATDKLNDGDGITEQFGIAPQLSTLELMMLPRSQDVIGGAISALLGKPTSFAFFDDNKYPPVTLFVWGRKKVIPVNITNMSINEQEFSTDLNPIRATVTVSLEVIEGPNAPFIYTQGMKEAMSLLNLANIGDLAGTIIPG